MLSASSDGDAGQSSSAQSSAVSIGVVPVGIPLLAGPGGLTAVMLEGHSGFILKHEGIVFAIIIGCSIVAGVILLFAGFISRYLGKTGMMIFERIFGLIVFSIGIEIIARGVLTHAGNFVQGL